LPALSSELHSGFPWLGIYRGLDDVRAFLAHMRSNLDVTAFGPREVVGADHRAAVFGWFGLTSRPAGREGRSAFSVLLEGARREDRPLPVPREHARRGARIPQPGGRGPSRLTAPRKPSPQKVNPRDSHQPTSFNVYDGAHLYLQEHNLEGWLARLDEFQHLAAQRAIQTIHPGHGPPGGLSLIQGTREYLQAFASAVETGDPDSAREAIASRFPDHRVRQFLDAFSLPAYIPAAAVDR
jgi:hypothetical protein